MANAILLIGNTGAGLTSAVMGFYHALDRKGIKTGFHKPVAQYRNESAQDDTITMMRGFIRGHVMTLSPQQIQRAFDEQHIDELMETAIEHFEGAKGDADVVVMEGLVETANVPYAERINQALARALDADIILVQSATVASLSHLKNQIRYARKAFTKRLLGAVINRVGEDGGLCAANIAEAGLFDDNAFKLIGLIPINETLSAPRVIDLKSHLGANIIFRGDIENRRIHKMVIFARSVPNATQFLNANRCIFCPGDRDDALMAVTISVANGTRLACLVMTGPTAPSRNVLKLCQPTLEKMRLPVLHVSSASSWLVIEKMQSFNQFMPADDQARMQHTQEYFADYLRIDWADDYARHHRKTALSPAAFRYQIVKRAIAAKRRIVLPEGDEPRTVVAACQAAARQIAHCVLLAEPDKVNNTAERQGVALSTGISIIDPQTIREKYVSRLLTLRKHKGMTTVLAREQLQDNVMLATMMLEADEVDGLVSGAAHTTANTMRPPLQIIKTAAHAQMVSSVFFMCLPDRVMVYGDCAIVPRPNATELAYIAIQSNDTAKVFGIIPKVAMIAYATGSSGQGEDIEKVKAATDLVRELRPDIVIDGPLQYDAAAVASVAASKAPDSPVAGQASVFIFPDLNTGNTTYKAVQRAANAVSMGPVLQGIRKPVNDLSRGALIDDIVYTIAITAVQAAL